MKKVVVFGAGLVAAPLVEYLLGKEDFQVTVATRTVSKAEKIIGKAPNGEAVAFTIDQKERLDNLIKEHDLAVSLLPYIHHVTVAKVCLKYGKHLVTTSYVSDAMRELDKEAKKAGVLFLNECGLDPGIDHMSAMKIIHEIQNKGGRVASFTSFCGGLPAPEANTNPFGYKFSWSPRGVLLAGKNSAHFLQNGKEVFIEAKDLFASYRMMKIEGVGEFEAYPNRDSVPYKDLYGIEDTDTILRGTLRYPGWCPTMKIMGDLGFLNEEPLPELAGKTYRELTAHLIGVREVKDEKEIRKKVAEYLGIDFNARELDRLEWLGLFSEIPLAEGADNALDYLCHLMQSKMPYEKGERDMIILQHNFVAEYHGGAKKEQIVSTLVEYGTPEGHTAMARTVGLPAAIATKMILNNEIRESGVEIPIKPEIYNPILDELEKEGIKFEERKEEM